MLSMSPAKIEFMRQHFTYGNAEHYGFYMTESSTGKTFTVRILRESATPEEARSVNSQTRTRFREILAAQNFKS